MTTTQFLTLEAFLQLPETKPASELQGKLCEGINQIAEPQKLAYAFPELRCSFGGSSIVPDIAVFRWHRIPLIASGRIANRFDSHPDWAIEILSPDQSQTKMLANLLHCSQNGTELGWLLDPTEETVLVVDVAQRIQLLRGATRLPVLPEISIELTSQQIFGWLTFGG